MPLSILPCGAVLLILLSSPARAAEDASKCVIQLDEDSTFAVLVDPSEDTVEEALAYPLTGFGDAEPGDLATIDRSDGVQLKVTKKADPACQKLVPKVDPHAHHRKKILPANP